ncbi:scaffold/adaptor protein [Lithospermum erythrorhizon]|uniref:Scaffold/adaptor protein n=1 Tax=Lithospermum erythrorhizon TaxID=34254 RepID=A0AAV3QBP1_LITER
MTVEEELKNAPEQSETQQQEKPVVSSHTEEEVKDAPEQSESQQEEKPVVSSHTATFSGTGVDVDEGESRVLHVAQGREHGGTITNRSDVQRDSEENEEYFLARVMHSFDAQEDGELSLAVGDCVVVRQVATNGWSEGECKGKAGWFPSAYVERPDIDSESKLSEDSP